MLKLFRVLIVLIVAVKLELVSSQTVCVDRVTNCREQLNIKNYCIDTNSEIRQFFITQCQKSCGVCGTGTGTGPTPNGCRTIAGPSFNRDCIFPFVFNGTRYNRCAFDSDGFWCSTLVDSRGTHISGNWGICGSNCPKVPTCSDGIQNQFETGIDCGGPCKACKNDPCNPNPCKNNGICTPKATKTYTCKCRVGFTGQNCNTAICEDKSKKCNKLKRFCGISKMVDKRCKKTCNLCTCGIPPTSRIVGGGEVTPYSIPWQVLFRGPNDETCGGTLISDRHVLTAAHCTRPVGYEGEIIVGEHDTNSPEDGTRHTYSLLVDHPLYDPNTFDYDFSILHLDKPVQIGARAVPACLPPKYFNGDFLDGKNLIVSGWGQLCQGDRCPSPPVLHSAGVPGMTNAVCNQPNFHSNGITDSMLCAGYAGGQIDSCQGDSGGPLTYESEGQAFIVGVVSWGIGCAQPNKPGIYARVTEVLPWINVELNRIEQSTNGTSGNRWSSLLKSSSISSGNGSNFCNAIEGDFEAVTLINEINKEREGRGLSAIPAADDMCVTALMKGFTQKADKKDVATHDFSRTGVKDVLSMKRKNQWKFPVNLIPSFGNKGSWRKPDEILGRSLQGECYGCAQSSSGFEIAHAGEEQGLGACDKKRNFSREAVKGWINSPLHRAVMFSEGTWGEHKWTRLGAAITSNCENKGTDNERLTYWANSWFSGQPLNK